MSNLTSFTAVPQTYPLTAPVSDLAVRAEQAGVRTQHGMTAAGADRRVTGPIAGSLPDHNSMINCMTSSMVKPMGAPTASAVGARSTKQAAPPRGRYR